MNKNETRSTGCMRCGCPQNGCHYQGCETLTQTTKESDCKLCQRKAPNFCKRHSPKVTFKETRLYTKEEIHRAFRKGVEAANALNEIEDSMKKVLEDTSNEN